MRLGKSSKFQGNKFVSSNTVFAPYSKGFKAYFKPIKINKFSEKFTVVLPLKQRVLRVWYHSLSSSRDLQMSPPSRSKVNVKNLPWKLM